MPNAYWSGTPEQFALIEKIQGMKRQYAENNDQIPNQTHSDRYTMVNPVTGRPPSQADLNYAAKNLQRIYESGAIREDRWAFLWYH